jgi:cytochrome c
LIQIKSQKGFQAPNTAVKNQSRTGKARTMKQALILPALVFAAVAIGPAQAQSVDVGAAEALTKKSGCMKCHSVAGKKDGPAFKETAAKYKGKPDGESKLFTHLTTNPKIKVDGKEELHESLKTKNEAEIKNVVAYILSR